MNREKVRVKRRRENLKKKKKKIGWEENENEKKKFSKGSRPKLAVIVRRQLLLFHFLSSRNLLRTYNIKTRSPFSRGGTAKETAALQSAFNQARLHYLPPPATTGARKNHQRTVVVVGMSGKVV